MAEREDGAAGGQGDPFGPGGEIGQVGEGVEDLARVAEVRIIERNVADPDGGEVATVDLGDQVRLSFEHAHVALIEAQGQEEADRQLVRREHAAIAGVIREGVDGRAKGRRPVAREKGVRHEDVLEGGRA
ncbi:hypothetical protein D3C72_1566730 [compost metagenome]